MIARTSCCQAFKGACSSKKSRTSRSGCSGIDRRLGPFLFPFGFPLACFFLEDLRRIDERVHVILALELRRRVRVVVFFVALEIVAVDLLAALDQRRVDVDQVLERQAAIDEVLDGFLAVPLHARADAIAVVGHLVHHLAVGLAEPDVVLEEVVVAINVGHDELLVDHLVAPQQVGVARVVIDDHLVDLLQPVAIALGELLVLHAKPPVRIPGGKSPQGGDLGKLVVIEDLEDRVVEVQPVVARVGFGFQLNGPEVIGQVVGVDRRHGFVLLSEDEPRSRFSIVRRQVSHCWISFLTTIADLVSGRGA